MKRCIVFLTVFLFFGNCYGQPSSRLSDFKKLYWLEGTWVRTNVKPGHSGNENWIIVSPTELQGNGISMNGADTTFIEKFQLVIKENDIYYVADVPENKQPVAFKLTGISTNEFSCENPEHDFPKKIRYRKDGNRLSATISGNGKSVDYFFEKK